jgi:pilus assembly protein Flp/PilA
MTKLFLIARSMLRRKEEGATMVEYGLMVALVAVACIVAVKAMSTGIQGIFTNITTALTNV